ncbi:MAG: hypothetical protein IMY72_04865 [Bacteroidetes bacterium]|nr:hypothetical protein [Bacteroidota bacterium]
MKKIFLISTIIFLTAFSVKSQFFIGTTGELLAPTSKFQDEIGYGAGWNFLLGYSINKKIDVDLKYSQLFFPNTFYDKYRISSISSSIKYFFNLKNCRPYLSIGAGYYLKKFDLFFSLKYEEKSLRICPSIGILADSKILKNLFVNTSLTYIKSVHIISQNMDYHSKKIDLFNFNVGLLYFFGND